MSFVHSPVLVREILNCLVGEQDKWYLDCTTGEGGHSEAVLIKYPGIRVRCIDRDREILGQAAERLKPFDGRAVFHRMNFSESAALINEPGFEPVDCALIDLGISVYHYRKSGRGFSFTGKEFLDMTLDDSSRKVYDIVNGYPEEELVRIFYQLGEERFSRLIAREIVRARSLKPVEYADELAALVMKAVPRKFIKPGFHPATQIFQALRIESNSELDHITRGLGEVFKLIRPGGRLGVISFHSLEDRIVKQTFALWAKDCICPPGLPVCICGKKKEAEPVGKPITPQQDEIASNPPSRSARLRIVRKL
jgi:16S rRNA (cytosine1402-N4)-methyltransferase